MYKHRKYIFLFLIVFLTLRVILPQLDGLKDSIAALKEADTIWILAGTVVYFSGVPIMTTQFMALSFKKLAFWLTFRVEAATMFVNKILPNGVGTISLNMYYLIKKNHTPNQATAVLTVNMLTSSIAYMLLIIYSLTQSTLSVDGLSGSLELPLNLIFFVIILVIGGIFTLYKSKFRTKIKNAWLDLKQNMKSYKKRPKAVFIGILCNGLGSLTSVFALIASAKAIGIDLTLAEALLAYTFSNVTAALVPTPGGIGSTEAGIYSGLVLTGISGPDAITITMLYRFITYWLPILPGYYFFWGLRKSLLANYSVKKKAT